MRDFVAQSRCSLGDISTKGPPDGLFECDTASTRLEWFPGIYIYGIDDLPAITVGLELQSETVDYTNLFIFSNSGLCFEMVGLDAGLLLVEGSCVGSVGISISSSEPTSSSRAPRAPVFGSARDGSERSVSSSKVSSTVGGRGGIVSWNIQACIEAGGKFAICARPRSPPALVVVDRYVFRSQK